MVKFPNFSAGYANLWIDCQQRRLNRCDKLTNKRGLMSKEEKTLCKMKKDYVKENLQEYKKLVSDARFVCQKCGRVARDSDRLCKPVSLDS